MIKDRPKMAKSHVWEKEKQKNKAPKLQAVAEMIL